MQSHGTTVPASSFRPRLGGIGAVLRGMPGRLAATVRLWAERDRERRELACMDHATRQELAAQGLDIKFETGKAFWQA
jgi:uncharacterized protein YjiS (DUF1127 family)